MRKMWQKETRHSAYKHLLGHLLRRRFTIFLVTALATGISWFGIAGLAYALPSAQPGNPGIIGVGLVLNGNGSTSPSSYSVSGVMGNGKNVPFTYYSKGYKGLEASGFYNLTTLTGEYGQNCQGNAGSVNSQQSQLNQLTLSVTLNGKSAAQGSPTVNLCSRSLGNIYYFGVNVVNPTQVRPTGSIYGTLTYADQNGKLQPFTSSAIGTLTDNTSKQTETATLNNSGVLTGPANKDKLVAGDSYTLYFSYNPNNPLGPHTVIYKKTFTLTPGQSLNVSETVKGYVGNGSASTSTSSATPTQSALQCGVKWFNPLTWLVCPVVDAAQGLMHYVGNLISAYLEIPNQYFDTANQTGRAVYTAWSGMRYLALGGIVIAALIMILSQAIGTGPFDAYTVRKLLPRLLFAAIFISLSWPLIGLMVGISNGIGEGIRALILDPFAHITNAADPSLLDLTGAVGGGAALGVALGMVGSLSFALSGAIAVLTGLAVIVLRQMIVILLVIFAPLAIIAYVLPGTDKGWKLWWDSFFGALLMFPLIEAFIALGAVFSRIALINAQASSTGTLTRSFDEIIAFVAAYVPYFLLPATVRFAGGAVRGIGGAVSGGSLSLHKRVQGYRQKTAEDRLQRARSNQLWSPSTRRGRVGNSVASWMTAPGSNIGYLGTKHNVPLLKNQGRRVSAQLHHAKMEQSMNLFKELNDTGAFNDKAYRALSGAHAGLSAATQARLRDAGLLNVAPRSAGDIQKMAHIMAESDSASEVLAANALEGSRDRLATLYLDPEMGKASLQAAGIMGLSAHGFASGQDLATVGNMISSSDSTDFAQGIISRAQVMGQQARPDIKAGYGIVYKDGKFVDGTSEEGGRALDLIKTLNSHDLSAAKGGALQKLRGTIESTIDRGSVPGADTASVGEARAVKDQLFQWAGPYSQASVDVKAQALDIIDKMSGGRKTLTRSVVERDAAGKEMRDESGNPIMKTETYTGYAPGTLGEEFERTLRTGRSPEEIEAMYRSGMGPEEPPDA